MLQELPSARAQQAQELVVLPDHQQLPATPTKGTSSQNDLEGTSQVVVSAGGTCGNVSC